MFSETVVVRPDLRQTLTERAVQEDRSVDELVNEAIDFYLRLRQQEKLDREIAVYTALHPSLWQKMPGKWVAIHDGKMVDSDADQAALYRRVGVKYERTAMLIRQVRQEATEELWVRTPSTGRVAV